MILKRKNLDRQKHHWKTHNCRPIFCRHLRVVFLLAHFNVALKQFKGIPEDRYFVNLFFRSFTLIIP